MSVSSIQGKKLEIIVIACNKLKDTEWLSRQDPYVCFEYGHVKHRTKICTDGGKNPTFNENLQIELIEGLREINVSVWNNNIMIHDYFIGSGRVHLERVLAEGFDYSVWPLQTKSTQYAGDLVLIMHFPKELQRWQWVPVQRVSDPSCSAPPAFPPQIPTCSHCFPSPTHYSECPSPAHPPPSPAYQYSPAHPPPSPAYQYSQAHTPPSSAYQYSPAHPPPSPAYQYSPAHLQHNRSGSFHGTYPPRYQ